jgi:hypothetical protein
MYFSLWKFSVIGTEVTHKPRGSLTNITKKSQISHVEVTRTSRCLFGFVTGMKRRKTMPEVIIRTQLVGRSVSWSVRPSVGPPVCPSVRRSVGPSVRLSVSPSVHLSVGLLVCRSIGP